MDDMISRQAAISRAVTIPMFGRNIRVVGVSELENLPSAQPEYTELTPEEAASEIASGSTMSAYYWLDDMIRLKQMGYAICRKKG